MRDQVKSCPLAGELMLRRMDVTHGRTHLQGEAIGRNQMLLALVAGRQHDQIGGDRVAAMQPRSAATNSVRSANCTSFILPSTIRSEQPTLK